MDEKKVMEEAEEAQAEEAQTVEATPAEVQAEEDVTQESQGDAEDSEEAEKYDIEDLRDALTRVHHIFTHSPDVSAEEYVGMLEYVKFSTLNTVYNNARASLFNEMISRYYKSEDGEDANE
jgi:hypothetical protein